jgi:serine/threonine protein kinase
MTPAQWARIRQIFEDAIEQPSETRSTFVEERCGGDRELVHEVESLLVSHDESSEFMASPAADLARAFAPVADLSDDAPRFTEAGPYHLERRIGRGGMGSVWLASRSDQAYQRKVAIKMVKRGMDTTEILRQFRRERQVLAGLDHPNIARLLDAGSTPEGTPYLVMEYVEGTPIDHYFERRKSSVTERLQLFQQVCSAVHYAHQNLVIHRDLKPGNILVTSNGVPKLLDFGIAKLLGSDGPGPSSETRPELRAMTLDYASPEQVRGAAMTTSSDVYSLGVLLFKLLTGKLPYARAHSRSELAKAICEAEPLRASTVVVSDDKAVIPQATQAIELGIETRDKARQRLRKKLRGDLDTILQQALAKEPLRRYLSVEQFSEDVRRYLEGRAVKARGDNASYRFGKFMKRNAPMVTMAAAILVMLVSVGVSAMLLARRVETQLKELETREARLKSEYVQALLALGEYDQQAANARTGNDFQTVLDYSNGVRETAIAARGVGLEQFRAGKLLPALVSFTKALKASEAWEAADPTSAEARSSVAAANHLMGQVLMANGDTDAARAKLRRAFDLYKEITQVSVMPPVDPSPAAWEGAIQKIAEKAPGGVALEILTSSISNR